MFKTYDYVKIISNDGQNAIKCEKGFNFLSQWSH